MVLQLVKALAQLVHGNALWRVVVVYICCQSLCGSVVFTLHEVCRTLHLSHSDTLHLGTVVGNKTLGNVQSTVIFAFLDKYSGKVVWYFKVVFVFELNAFESLICSIEFVAVILYYCKVECCINGKILACEGQVAQKALGLSFLAGVQE